MDTTEQTRELFAVWQRSMQQGLAAWQGVLTQAQGPRLDPAAQMWTLLGVQGLEAWMQALQQGKSPADALAEWKKMMDQSVEACSKLLEAAMGTEAFAVSMGTMLDQYLTALGPFRKTLQGINEEFLRTMNLPSRTQVTGIATQLVGLDERLEAVEGHLEEIATALATSAAQAAPPTPASEAPPERPRPRKNGRQAASTDL